MLARLDAMAGAPVSPARMSAVPRPLLFLGRRRGPPLLASALCNWSAEVLSSGNGSDMMGEVVVEYRGGGGGRMNNYVCLAFFFS